MGKVMTKNFKKPPVLCNDECNNFNCTYTFYEEPDCITTDVTSKEPDFRTTTLYPYGCDDPVCQRDVKALGLKGRNKVEDFGFDFEEHVGPPEGKQCTKTSKTGEKTKVACGYKATSNLIVRGWGTYFELDRTYKSVKFNGYGNCAFFLYEKPWFQGERGHFRGYWTGNEKNRPWNGKRTPFAGPGNLCRNINVEHFNQKTGSLETNDSCWETQNRTKQSQSGTWQQELKKSTPTPPPTPSAN